jgi:dethiobiotin synthetase
MGWVANTADAKMGFVQENIQALQARIDVPLLGHIPRLDRPTAEQAASYLAHVPVHD